MSIRSDSKKIIQYFLEKAIACGDLRKHFPLDYEDIAKTLNLESRNYCRVCCQYMFSSGYAASLGSENNLSIELLGKSIDFIEGT